MAGGEKSKASERLGDDTAAAAELAVRSGPVPCVSCLVRRCGARRAGGLPRAAAPRRQGSCSHANLRAARPRCSASSEGCWLETGPHAAVPSRHRCSGSHSSSCPAIGSDCSPCRSKLRQHPSGRARHAAAASLLGAVHAWASTATRRAPSPRRTDGRPPKHPESTQPSVRPGGYLDKCSRSGSSCRLLATATTKRRVAVGVAIKSLISPCKAARTEASHHGSAAPPSRRS